MLISRLKSAYNKNWPELMAAINGQLPDIVLKKNTSLPLKQILTFVFHTTDPKLFEEQLQFIASNGYRTLDADELYEKTLANTFDGNEIALTFDDATSTFWTYAFPLLKKYNCKAILFAIAGLVPRDSSSYPNLDDYWNGEANLDDLKTRLHTQPLCTWNELIIMNNSGIIDIQSHSMTHARIPISTKIIDFIHPKFDPYFYGNIEIPLSSEDDDKNPKRKLKYGMPVFKYESKLACSPRFFESTAVTNSIRTFIEEKGGTTFFKDKNWRKQLIELLNGWSKNELGSFESIQQTKESVKFELSQSKNTLENNLHKKTIQHFCYPWYESTELSDELAYESGYRCLYYGFQYNYPITVSLPDLVRILRISEEYLFRLPGKNRVSYLSIWSKRAHNFLQGKNNDSPYTK